jgi:hypothetical protein
MVTDPPYGVAYDPTWRARAGVNLNRQKLGAVPHDDRADWTDAWRLFPGNVSYVRHAGLHASASRPPSRRADFAVRAQIVWAKDRLALSRGDYHWQHEPCWYAVRTGAAAQRTDDRTQSTLWTIPATATMRAMATGRRSRWRACGARCRTTSPPTSMSRSPARAPR